MRSSSRTGAAAAALTTTTLSDSLVAPDELRIAAHARVSRTLCSRFRLLRLIGVGGMGAVYEASDRGRARVALKVLHPSLALSARHLLRFAREARLANAVPHPGVVRVCKHGIDRDGTAFLVMELLQGRSVAVFTNRTRSVARTARVFALADRALDVLAAAHAHGVIHRDIKPGNLFLTRRAELKILDFGIARSIEPAGDAELATLADSVLGTPAYMSPEQARGHWRAIDGRSDLWSLGATMFKLLSGEPVHVANTPNEQLGLAMFMHARSIAAVRPDLPDRLASVIDRALRYDPAERWPDAPSMQRALRSALAVAAIPPPGGFGRSPANVRHDGRAPSPPGDETAKQPMDRLPSAVRLRRKRRRLRRPAGAS